MGRIFISHRNTRADNFWAEKVHRWIKDQKGISGFLDFDIQDGLQTGQRWEDEIYAAMRGAQVVIAIVSNDWLKSDWCLSEARMARLLGSKLILIITEECEVPFRDTQSIRLEKHGEASAFEELRQALRTTHSLPERPYPGLAAFEEKDAAVFFGREDETRELVNKVNSLFQGRPETPRLLFLLGASGSGKSSLMRAGLIPGFASDPKHLAIKPIIPHGDPLGELARALGLELGGLSVDEAAVAVFDSIEDRCSGYERVLLPIDQAEELLRGEYGNFFDVMRAVLDKGMGRVIALATMRSDFLNAFQQSGLVGTGTALPYDTFTLDPLPKDRLPDIIQGPAGLFGVTFEEGLVARIMQDHGGDDALPLLAFFLSEFWRPDYISDGILQLPEYESFGGLNKALKRAVGRAIDACKAVEPDHGRLMGALQNVFLGRLVAISADSGEAVRSRAAADRLTEQQARLLEKFAAQRLLIERDNTWEVVHEALLRQWEDLRDWIAEAREDLVAIDRIEAAAAHWKGADEEEADLTHGGNRLAEAVRMLASPRYADRFDKSAKAYIDACRQKEDDRYQRERTLREAAERERDRATQGESTARRFTRIAAMVAMLALIASGFAYWQWGEAREQTAEAGLQAARAEQSANEAEDQRAMAENAAQTAQGEARRALKNQRLGLAALSSSELQAGHAMEAVMLALAAWPRHPDPEDDLSDYRVALNALHRAGLATRETVRLEGHKGRVSSVAFSSDGTRLATGGWDGTARLWDIATGTETERLEGHEGPVSSVAFSPDGTRLATASEDGTARLWDIATGTETERLEGHEGPVSSVAFSPDGTRLAAASEDGTARLWDLAKGTEIARLEGHDGEVTSVAFSPDGTRLATASEDGTARLWDVATGTETERLQGHEGPVSSVAFSPDGTRLATAGGETAQLWDLVTGTETARLEGHDGEVTSVAFSPDSTRLATAGGDTARLWDLATGAETAWLAGHDGEVTSVAFSPDGTRLATGGMDGRPVATGGMRARFLATKRIDGTARLWDLVTGTETARLERHDGGVTGVAFSPDGARLATAGGDTARLWDLATGTETARLEGHDGAIYSIAFSPDGTRLATAGLGDGTARLWDLAKGTETARLQGHDGWFTSVAFSPDGTRLATAGGETARLWDLSTGMELARLEGHDGAVGSVAFSPDGMRLATAGDAKARLWDLATGTKIAQLEGHFGAIYSIAFSPDGTRLATAGDDRTVRLWGVATGTEIARLEGHEGPVSSVAFSPDGTRLATAGLGDGTARLWDLATGKEIARLEGHENRVHSVAFSPDGTRLATGGEDGTARLWDIDYGPGNLFEVICRSLRSRSPPAILETYGIVYEPICTGEEPLPPLLPAE